MGLNAETYREMKRDPVPDRDRGGPRRVVSIAGGAVIAVIFLGLAMIFTNAYGSSQVAANARSLHWTNATLGAASIARASNAQALVFAVDAQLGVATSEAAERARAEARSNLAELERWAAAFDGSFGTADSADVLLDFLTTANQAIDLLDAGELDAAIELTDGQLERSYATLSIALESTQQAISEDIDDTEALAGLVAAITRFLVTLLIPVGTILIYRWLVHRQALRANLALEVKLKAEQELRIARDEFIANISHEIRTPLTSIYGFSEVLVEEGLVDPEMAMELITLINGESAELSRMVEDLLTAARLDANVLHFKYEAVSVAEEIETVTAPMIRGGADLRIDVPRALVWTDQMRYRQIVRNLISNALKHGGPNVTVTGRSDGERFVLVVADDGTGVPEDIEGRIFERFVHEGKEPLLVGSVGLGLSIAKMLADEMDGDLTYQRVGEETQFVLSVAKASDVVRDAEFVEDTAVGPVGRLGGVAASFAGEVAAMSGKADEGSSTRAAGDPWSLG